MDSPQTTKMFPDNPDGAEGLRNQAAACRRLAGQARTRAGTTSMHALADHFDAQAQKLDPTEATSPADEPIAARRVAK